MSLFTSCSFASSCAAGTDWRDISKKVLEELQSAKTREDSFNIGFLYISDHLSDDVSSILNLFKSVLGIECWVGGDVMGVCGSGQAFVDTPAIAAMVGYLPEGEFCLYDEDVQAREKWLASHDSMLGIIHGNPYTDEKLESRLIDVQDEINGFVVGGLSSSRKSQNIIAGGNLVIEPLSGVVFSSDVAVATALAQGCQPIGETHSVTSAEDHTIYELNGENAVQVFEDDLRVLAVKRIEANPSLKIAAGGSGGGTTIHNISEDDEDMSHVMQGQISIAFPIRGSDQRDYTVREIVGLDTDENSLTISQPVSHGDQVMFVARNNESAAQDLTQKLLDLRARVQKDTGTFAPKAAFYVSCVGRGVSQGGEKALDEIQIIRDVIGDVPLSGFYAAGEISGGQIYGYAGVLTLFL